MIEIVVTNVSNEVGINWRTVVEITAMNKEWRQLISLEKMIWGLPPDNAIWWHAANRSSSIQTTAVLISLVW